MAGKATFKPNISSSSLAKRAITVHTGQKKDNQQHKVDMPRSWKCRQKCSWNHCHREQNWFNFGDMAAAYLKCFEIHLGGQWMRLTLGRRQEHIGDAPIVDWVHRHWFQSNGSSLWSIPSCILNATGHMWRQVLHPSNYCPSLICWFPQHTNWIFVITYSAQVNKICNKSLHYHNTNQISAAITTMAKNRNKTMQWEKETRTT